MSAWPRLTAPVDPLETWHAYQWQSQNTRGGVVPDIRKRFEERVAAQTYAGQQESALDPNYAEGV